MTITPADALILCGVVMAVLGLIEPAKLLAKMHLDATTLVVSGVIIALVGMAISVFTG